jgi:SAM-dependent methyltransferase
VTASPTAWLSPETPFLEVTSCPVCESTESEVVGNLAVGFEVPVGSTTFHQPDYNVKKCRSCCLCYKSITLSEPELKSYYELADFQKWELAEFAPSERVLLEILRELPVGSKILDYGCSSGRLMSPLVSDYRCFGIEPNERAAECADARGITVIPSHEANLLSLPKFDAIVLSDVFEHLQQPTRVLQSLVQFLNPLGLLLLCTGNADAAVYQKDIANNWYFRNIEHLCMLSRATTDFLAERLCLPLVRWKEVSHGEVSWRQKANQRFLNTLYWQFKVPHRSRWTSLLAHLPKINLVRNWVAEPPIYHTKDHAIAVFQKQN